MRFNLHWLAVKQLRFSCWLYQRIFNFGLGIHILKKYHKLNPSVAEILAAQSGGKLYKYQIEKLQWSGLVVPDSVKVAEEKLMMLDTKTPIPKRLLSLKIMIKDVQSGMLDHDEALKEEIISRIALSMKQVAIDLNMYKEK